MMEGKQTETSKLKQEKLFSTHPEHFSKKKKNYILTYFGIERDFRMELAHY